MGHSDRAHAPFSPSAAERWLNCPMAVRYAEQLPPQAASKDTDFGTRCHEIAEQAIRGEWDGTLIGAAALKAATAWIEQWGVEDLAYGEVALDMERVILPYVEFVRSITTMDCTRRIEERVTVQGKECWGSLDCSVFVPFDTLFVVDLKGGRGKCVDAAENPQLLTYAVGEAIRNEWAFDKVVLVIVQPRRTDGKPPVDTWETTAERLRKHHADIKKAIKRAKVIDAAPVAGPWCGWCVAKALCPAQRQQALACLGEPNDPGEAKILQLPQPGALTPEQLSRVLQHRKAIEKWLEACGALALTQPPPGWKIVEGSSKRRWAKVLSDDLPSALSALELEGLTPADFTATKLIGVTDAEKRLKEAGRKDLIEALFEKPRGKPALARVDDKRPALDPLAALPADDDDE